MTYRYALVEQDGHILTVTIDRPEVRNALNPAANHEMGRIFDDFEADPALRLAIVTGAGDKAFCAGADLKTAGGIAGSDVPFVPASGFGGLHMRYHRAKPVIAAVNGFATGGGFELALACDIIVAADTAQFGLTEPRVGLAALGGGIQRLIREIGLKRANAMLLTGRIVSAGEGKDLGFVNAVVPPDRVMAEARRWAEDILRCSPSSIRATKAVADNLDGQTVAASIDSMMHLPEVEALLASADAREGPRAFAERRTPHWANI